MNNTDSGIGPSIFEATETAREISINRFTRIDSIRGLAALAVAVGHSILASPLAVGLLSVTIWNFSELTLIQKILRIFLVIFNGGAAVVCFFVISGFVLSGALKRLYARKNSNWIIEFYKKRIYRIYPALIVGYIILGLYLDTSAAGLSQDMLLVTTIGNPVTWSLKVEILMAFLLPLFFLLFRTKYKFLPIGTALIVFLLYKFNLDTLFSVIPMPKFIMGQFLYFIRISYYSLPFVIGMYGYEYYDHFKKYCGNKYLLLFGVLLLCLAEFLVGSDSYYAVFIQSFASLVVIVGCNESSAASWLSLQPLVWLGKISYSFYLYHPIALYILIFTLFPRLGVQYPLDHMLLNIPFITITGVGFAILLGWLSYKFVEQPFLMSKS